MTTRIKPDLIASPFISFLRECSNGAQYLAFDGENYSVVVFRNDEAAEAYTEAMQTAQGRAWRYASVEVLA